MKTPTPDTAAAAIADLNAEIASLRKSLSRQKSGHILHGPMLVPDQTELAALRAENEAMKRELHGWPEPEACSRCTPPGDHGCPYCMGTFRLPPPPAVERGKLMDLLESLRAENARLRDANARHALHHIEKICGECGHDKDTDGKCANCIEQKLIAQESTVAIAASVLADKIKTDEANKRLGEHAMKLEAAIAAKDAALHGLMAHKRHNQYCPKLTHQTPCQCGSDESFMTACAALSPGAGTGWLPANEAEKLRAELAELRAALEYASRASNSPADIQAFAEVLRGNGGNWSAIDAARAGEEGAKCKRCEGTGKVALSREPCCTEEITCPDCKGSDNAGGAKV